MNIKSEIDFQTFFTLTVSCFLFSGFLNMSSAIAKDKLPDQANKDYPCFVRYEPDSALGQFLTGRNKGKPGGFYSYYLAPPMMEAEGWEYVTDNRGAIFCTGSQWGDEIARLAGSLDLKNRHALWRSPDGNKVYLYDFELGQKVHIWSRVKSDNEMDEIWIDHIHRLAWSDRVYDSYSSPDGSMTMDKARLVTYEEAIQIANEYTSLGVPSGYFELPSEVDVLKSQNFGLVHLAPGMSDFDPNLPRYKQSYRNFYWLARPQTLDHRTAVTLVGSQGLVSRSFYEFRDKNKRNYVRFVIRADALKQLQDQGILPAQEL